MDKYILDKMLLYNIQSSNRNRRFRLNIKKVGFTDYGFFVDLTMWVNEVKMEGILGITYKKKIKDIVELQEMIPDIDMELSCNEKLESRCKLLANEFKDFIKVDFDSNNSEKDSKEDL